MSAHKRRMDLRPGDQIHNLTLLADGMRISVSGTVYVLAERTDRAPAFMATAESGERTNLWVMRKARVVFLGWAAGPAADARAG